MTDVIEIAKRADIVSRRFALTSTKIRVTALNAIADCIWASRHEIFTANQADVDSARSAGLSEAMIDRLVLNEQRLAGIVADLRRVAVLPDPVGVVFEESVLPNGLRIRKQRVPLGVLAAGSRRLERISASVTDMSILPDHRSCI